MKLYPLLALLTAFSHLASAHAADGINQIFCKVPGTDFQLSGRLQADSPKPVNGRFYAHGPINVHEAGRTYASTLTMSSIQWAYPMTTYQYSNAQGRPAQFSQESDDDSHSPIVSFRGKHYPTGKEIQCITRPLIKSGALREMSNELTCGFCEELRHGWGYHACLATCRG